MNRAAATELHRPRTRDSFVVDSIDLHDVEECDFTTGRALAFDGAHFWYAGQFTVYELDAS